MRIVTLLDVQKMTVEEYRALNKVFDKERCRRRHGHDLRYITKNNRRLIFMIGCNMSYHRWIAQVLANREDGPVEIKFNDVVTPLRHHDWPVCPECGIHIPQHGPSYLYDVCPDHDPDLLPPW